MVMFDSLRRELHTGRYNMLHRDWGPIEPFDDSMPQILKQHGIHTHLTTDHYHYLEDGGSTYHSRYSTWECCRGHESDTWVAGCYAADFPGERSTGGSIRQIWTAFPACVKRQNESGI